MDFVASNSARRDSTSALLPYYQSLQHFQECSAADKGAETCSDCCTMTGRVPSVSELGAGSCTGAPWDSYSASGAVVGAAAVAVEAAGIAEIG